MAHRAFSPLDNRGPSPHPAARALPHTAPLMRTERELERERGRGQQGCGRAPPQPQSLERLRRAVHPEQRLMPLPAPSGLDAEGLSRGHQVTPHPGPYPGPQNRRSLTAPAALHKVGAEPGKDQRAERGYTRALCCRKQPQRRKVQASSPSTHCAKLLHLDTQLIQAESVINRPHLG